MYRGTCDCSLSGDVAGARTAENSGCMSHSGEAPAGRTATGTCEPSTNDSYDLVRNKNRGGPDKSLRHFQPIEWKAEPLR